MVAVSTMIACFGLITNSTAVVIGAMLVAPLMTPIFGIALALVRGDTHLFGRAVRAEVAGVAAAIAMGFILGLLLGGVDPTPEMLARTQPNLFDLLVAVFAGFAGAYALVDEKISPALPGVAIATAIVPPLANTGLCLSLGAVKGGTGSFLLFCANFLSILLVASAVFVASGMSKDYGASARKLVVRRFGLAAVGFILVAVFLSHTLVQIMAERKLDKTIRTVLNENLSDFPATGIDRVVYHQDQGRVHVLANVHTPSNVSAFKVKYLQNALESRIEKPVELVVRTIKTNDISAVGSAGKLVTQNLDGEILKKNQNPTIYKIVSAEQVIRNYLETRTGMQIYDVDYVPITPPVIAAAISGMRQLTPDEIKSLEQQIRNALNDEAIELVIMNLRMDISTRMGKLRYGWALQRLHSPRIRTLQEPISAAIVEKVATAEGFAVININAAEKDGMLHFLAEVAGPRIYSQAEVQEIENDLREQFKQPIRFYVLSRPEVVVSRDGLLAYEQLATPFYEQQEGILQEELQKLFEEFAD
jgi:uncharacterized hydrophobic protein (TIGR00271 family)